MLAEEVGRRLAGRKWVGVAFAGGMAELKYLTARTLLVNDLHRHVINLARAVACNGTRPILIRRLRRKGFHPDELKQAQEFCTAHQPAAGSMLADITCAENYFVCCWMGRSSLAGTKNEFTGRTATRWNAAGGDSAVRYRSALRSLGEWGRVFRRCTFETMDAFLFLARCEDSPDNGIYCDPPFPVAGRAYAHNCGGSELEELAWHTELAKAAGRFQKTRVVMRFYDHPLIRSLYPEALWTWHLLEGRKQTNDSGPEVLLVNHAP